MRGPRVHPGLDVQSDRGTTSVEFAIVLPVLLTLIGGVMVLALAMVYSGLAEHAARIGLREAVIRTSGGYPEEARVREFVDKSLGTFMPAPLNNRPLLVRDPGDVAKSVRKIQGDRITVRVEYEIPVVSSALGLIPDAGLRAKMADLATITRTAKGRLE